MNRITGTLAYGQNKAPASWSHAAFSYRVTLRYQRRQMSVDFHCGSHAGEPSIDGVLDCLASDSIGIDNAPDFWDWCDEYGMEPTREGKATFEAVKAQAADLRHLLGEDFEDIVYCDGDKRRRFCGDWS